MTETPPDLPPVQPANPTGEEPASAPAPAKKAPAKKAAKKAAAKPPEEEKAKPNGSLYLPALPDGFAYTQVVATGPRGETLTVAPLEGGRAEVHITGNDLDRKTDHPDMKHALGAAARKAKAMSDLAKREAELAALRQEAFDL